MSSIQYLILFLLSFGLIHCNNSVDGTLFNQHLQKNCLDDDESSCFASNSDNLTLDSKVRSITLKPNQLVFNVGGECNEGGYPMNRIDWHLSEENSRAVIANSLGKTNPKAICGDPNALGQTNNDPADGLENSPGVCSNGRFNIKIKYHLNTPISASHNLYLVYCWWR